MGRHPIVATPNIPTPIRAVDETARWDHTGCHEAVHPDDTRTTRPERAAPCHGAYHAKKAGRC